MMPVEAGSLQKPSGFRSLFHDKPRVALGTGLPTPPVWLVLYFKEMFSW